MEGKTWLEGAKEILEGEKVQTVSMDKMPEVRSCSHSHSLLLAYNVFVRRYVKSLS